MHYFAQCTTIEELKAAYKKLAKQYHPDCGGDTEIMQEINLEYDYACAKILNATDLNEEDLNEQIRLSEEYRNVIAQIIHLADILIEVVGNWIWVTGNTFPVRKQLKQAGLFFASKKLAWYYRAEEYKTKGGKKSLDEIRAKYGSEKINTPFHSRTLG